MIRVFARKTSMTPNKDDLAFYDEPPLFNLPDMPVMVSVTFSWDVSRGHLLAAAWRKRVGESKVFVGGPAFSRLGMKNDFVAGRFLKKGITITSRGCLKKCSWCRVWFAEGPLKEINITPGHIIQDNNLLSCSRGHIEKVFAMLEEQRGVQFKGGLDIDYLEPWHVEAFKQLSINELWVACDNEVGIKRLDKAADLLSDFSIEKRRCYVLIAHTDAETPAEAEKRCEAVLAKGFLPFAQLYQPVVRKEYTPEWKAVARKWSRPAAYRSKKDLTASFRVR